MANLVARARDPLCEEPWGSGKKPKRMHEIHLNFLTMEPLQGVENDIDRKNYAPCPGIKTLNHIESEPVNVFVKNIWPMPACNLHSMCNFSVHTFLYCAICIVLVNLLFCTV